MFVDVPVVGLVSLIIAPRGFVGWRPYLQSLVGFYAAALKSRHRGQIGTLERDRAVVGVIFKPFVDAIHTGVVVVLVCKFFDCTPTFIHTLVVYHQSEYKIII
jgi:hypothetical protein